MVVDPGIHVMGWTREKAVNYLMGTGRFTLHEAESLVDRIVACPGQLTTYDTGAIEIFALREKAKKALGDRFDIRAFHDQILKYGPVTLPMLREIIDHWLAGVMSGLFVVFPLCVLSSVTNLKALLLSVPTLLKFGLALPLIAALLGIGVLFYMLKAWRKGYWTLCQRLHYTLVFVAALVFIWLLNFWNFLGWRF